MDMLVNFTTRPDVKSTGFSDNSYYKKQNNVPEKLPLEMKDTFNDDFNEMVHFSWIS